VKVLALDTAARTCSVALVEGGRLRVESSIDSRETHSRHLAEMVRGILGFAGLEAEGIDGLAVTRGPGSFTGLRIGISFMKGLAWALGKPLVGVSTLEVLALQARTDLPIRPWLDARRGEVYFARLRRSGEGVAWEAEEAVAAPAEALREVREPSLFIGEGALLFRGFIQETLGELAFFAPEADHPIRASVAALAASRRFADAGPDSAARLVPRYLRRPDIRLKGPGAAS